jgi:hypothetical protein
MLQDLIDDLLTNAMTGMPSILLPKLLEQIKKGFERRDEDNVKKVFDKFAVDPGGAQCWGGLTRSAQKPPALSKQQFRLALEHLQYGNGRDMDNLFKNFDINDDEHLDFEEFKQLLQSPSQVEEWTKSLPLHHLLADALPRSEKKLLESDIDDLEDLIHLRSQDLSDVITAFSEGLMIALEKAIMHLKNCISVGVDSKQNDVQKDNCKFSVFTMKSGLIDDFHAGLSGRIGVQANSFFCRAFDLMHCLIFFLFRIPKSRFLECYGGGTLHQSWCGDGVHNWKLPDLYQPQEGVAICCRQEL